MADATDDDPKTSANEAAAKGEDELEQLETLLTALSVKTTKRDQENEKEKSEVKLRPYQQKLVATAMKHLNCATATTTTAKREGLLLYLPTGAGKTLITSSIAKTFADSTPNCTVMVFVHKEDLVQQHADTFTNVLSLPETDVAFIKAGRTPLPSCGSAARIVIASVQSFCARFITRSDEPPLENPPRLVIIDEAHHAVSAQYASALALLTEWNPSLALLGVTATPFRTKQNEKLESVFARRVDGPSISQLIAEGFLVPPLVYGPSTGSTTLCTLESSVAKNDKTIRAAVKRWRAFSSTSGPKHTPTTTTTTRKTLALCVDLAHARALAEAFENASIPAKVISGSIPPRERAALLRDSREGAISVLCAVDVVGEGTDMPWIDCLLLLRPTFSRSLFVQQLGRGLRPFPGKANCLVLDEVGNSVIHGAVHSFSRTLLASNSPPSKFENGWEAWGSTSASTTRVWISDDDARRAMRAFVDSRGRVLQLVRTCGRGRALRDLSTQGDADDDVENRLERCRALVRNTSSSMCAECFLSASCSAPASAPAPTPTSNKNP